MIPRRAMLLAAGLGTRMRPLSATIPKPLLPLGGKTLLDHALDRLEAVGVERVIVNVHWQADRIAEHLARRTEGPQVQLMHEAALLDTGGAVRAALHELGPDPFYVVNGDTFWMDGVRPALRRLADAWSDAADGVLLVHRSFQVQAETGFGDFLVDPWGKLRRRAEREVAPYVYAGLQLISPAVLDDATAESFSLNLCWDRALARQRLSAVVHDGLWFHLSTPADLAEAESVLQTRGMGELR